MLGFARFLGELLEKESPRHIAVAFDESLETSYRNASIRPTRPIGHPRRWT